MELAAEQFEQFDKRLQAVEQGQHSLEQGQHSLERKLDRDIAGIKQAIADSQARIIQWVVGLFIGSTVMLATLAGVYISVLVLLAQ